MKNKLYILSVFVLVMMLMTTGCKDKITYTVVYNSNGGSGTMQPQVFAEDEEKNLSSNAFVRENYNFSGWNTLRDGSGTAYSDGQKIRLVSDITLYAQWVANADTTSGIGATVYVTFDANGGAGEMQPQPFTTGIAQALSANEFTRENYGFVNWNTAADGSGRTYSDSQEVTISVNTTLYAQWIALPDLTEHFWVDLGLPSGTKWATYNIGAANPEEYGEFFVWGEIAEKGAYSWESYRYAEGTSW
ncbi:MAG: InlB B-repeat-containing protein, partial [Bacteroidales bacterium]|nr:InlB B-repeat-containing protein [Bacteroidales bacterium]